MRVLQDQNWWLHCGMNGVLLFAMVAAIGVTGMTFGQRLAIPVTKDQVIEQRSIDLGSKRQAVEEGAHSAPSIEAPVQKKFSGRLPTYYSKIVNDQQRQYIYLLQWRYEQEIRKYEAHLKKLVLQRNKMIYNVLSPQQKEQLRKLQQ